MDQLRVSCGGLDLPSICNFISDQGLRQQFLRGMSLVSRMKPIARHILLVMIIGLVTYARLQHASAETGVVNDNRQRFSIAVPDFSDSSTSDGASWSTMAQAIASDLRASGRFALIESNLPIESNVPTEGRADALPHFDRWRETDAKWLVIGRLKQQDHSLLVRFQLWNVVKGQQLLGQQYVVGSDDMQGVPHVIAGEIFKQLTGESGPSDGAADRK
jgi:TolB protein